MIMNFPHILFLFQMLNLAFLWKIIVKTFVQSTNVYYFCESTKEILNMMDEKERQELKAIIEEEEEFLRFFALYEEEFKQDESEREWEVAVDESLDILIPLYQQLNEG